jgi:hypothetical protein
MRVNPHSAILDILENNLASLGSKCTHGVAHGCGQKVVAEEAGANGGSPRFECGWI